MSTTSHIESTKQELSISYRSALLLTLTLIPLFALLACSSQGIRPIDSNTTSVTLNTKPKDSNATTIKTDVAGAKREGKQTYQKLMAHYEEWRGVRYRLGGKSKKGIDCSAFVQVTYSNVFNIKLPRTTNKQHKIGITIERKQLNVGDLVFFKINRRVDHVGVYLGKGRFMHASTSSGVMISELKQEYWAKRYWKAVRV